MAAGIAYDRHICSPCGAWPRSADRCVVGHTVDQIGEADVRHRRAVEELGKDVDDLVVVRAQWFAEFA